MQRCLALAITGLFSFGAKPNMTIAHYSLDQKYYGENCIADEDEAMKEKNLDSLTRNFELLHIDL